MKLVPTILLACAATVAIAQPPAAPKGGPARPGRP